MPKGSTAKPGLVSAELRWFWAGACPQAVADWFNTTGLRPGGGEQPREDRYFHQQGNDGLGIKVRDARDGSPPDVEVKGLVTFRDLETDLVKWPAQIWCKWKAPILQAPSVIITQKIRYMRKFGASLDAPTEIQLGRDEQALTRELPDVGCNVELTTVRVHGRSGHWCTLCFEAFGGLDAAPAALARVIRIMAPLPAFDGDFLSYPAWLDSL